MLERRVVASGSVITEIADNDFSTYSSQRNYRIDIRRNNARTKVTHIFIRCSGVSSYVVIDGGRNHRRNIPSNNSKYGFQYDLWELPRVAYNTHINVRFTGDSARIYELWLLEEAIGFDTDKKYLSESHTKIEVAGGIHHNQFGKATRYKRRGAGRWIWNNKYSCLFEQSEYDEIFVWLEKNPVFMFCRDSELFVHQTYPATHLLKDYSAIDRSIVKNSGTIANFEIQEYNGYLYDQPTSQDNLSPITTPGTTDILTESEIDMPESVRIPERDTAILTGIYVPGIPPADSFGVRVYSSQVDAENNQNELFGEENPLTILLDPFTPAQSGDLNVPHFLTAAITAPEVNRDTVYWIKWWINQN